MAQARTRKVYGMGAEFPSAAALYHAAEKVRDKGFKRWDTHSPFPIHGIEHAMGLGKSWLSIWVFIGGTCGFLTAMVLEFYPTWFDYPLIVHGKPYDWSTVPPMFPIMFELTVLFSAFSAVFALMIMNLLPMWYHPVFNWDRFAKVTDNGFFLIIEARDPQFSETATRLFLEELGGAHVTLIHD